MAESILYKPQSLQDLLSLKESLPETVLYAGGTELLREDGNPRVRLGEHLAYIGQIPELAPLARTERYIDIGSGATIAGLIESKSMPPFLVEAAKLVGNAGIRNLATVGGNLCTASRRMDLWAPLSACEAKLELRSAAGNRWIGINRFSGVDGTLALQGKEVLCRIRVPIENWNLQLTRKIGNKAYPDPSSAMFCCIGLLAKDVVQDLRIAYSGRGLFRDRTIENLLIGRKLPLSAKEVEAAALALSEGIGAEAGLDPVLREQYLALFRWSMGYLS